MVNRQNSFRAVWKGHRELFSRDDDFLGALECSSLADAGFDVGAVWPSDAPEAKVKQIVAATLRNRTRMPIPTG
jgi:hypothetical protein